ncbi:unnamed protein product [Linum trigynum]|uniref:Uncharacterized protein n=1 Tax=Linum trigynum TaxID=586398 RepID=A0AAV2EXR4_9ROSI
MRKEPCFPFLSFHFLGRAEKNLAGPQHQQHIALYTASQPASQRNIDGGQNKILCVFLPPSPPLPSQFICS